MDIALDPGYGNTKVCVDGRTTFVQSAVSHPRAIGMAGIGMRKHRSVLQVQLPGGQIYAAGDGAWTLGEPIGSMDYNALASEARKALFYAATSQLLRPGSYQADLVIGLPVPLLQDETAARPVLAALRDAYKPAHCWITGGQEYHLEITRMRVVAQPVGAYTDWLLNDNLHAPKGAAEKEVAVLDLGMNTLDLYVLQNREIIGRYIGGAKVGVRKVLTTMNGHGQDLEELDHDLRSGAIQPERGELRAWLNEVLGQIERTWSNLKRFKAVIPCGGGALVLGDLLRDALIDRGAAVAWPGDPVTTNVRGLWKWHASSRK